MTKAIIYILAGATLWLIISACAPYWNRYWIKTDLSTAALYGTKHSVEETRDFLSKKLKDRGHNLDPDKISLEKDENNTVSIIFTYQDKISYFGVVLKELHFTLKVKESDTKAYL